MDASASELSKADIFWSPGVGCFDGARRFYRGPYVVSMPVRAKRIVLPLLRIVEGIIAASAVHPRDLVESIQIVLQEKRCDVVTLSSGHVDTEDGGVDRLEKWVTEIRKHLNILIALDLVPPETNDWIDTTYAMGVDALYYDSDFFNPEDEAGKDFEKHKRRQLEALRYAAKIFPTGAVLSHLVIGFEPLAETLKSIDLLIDHGVVPVLVYFPPYDRSALQSLWTATPEEAQQVYAHLYERLVRTRINPHWVQQYDVVLTSLEGRFLSPESPRYHLKLKNFYETKAGRALRFGLASLRRHLRVRVVPA